MNPVVGYDNEYNTVVSVINRVGPARARGALPSEAISAQRAVVLEVVQQQSAPVSIATIAELLDLHPNTIREHLDALVDRRYVDRTSAAPAGRGRPAALYAAVEVFEPDPRVREYMGLADALAAYIERTAPDPASAALEAGYAWGNSLASVRESSPSMGARDLVLSTLDELGFSPEVTPTEAPSSTRVRLRRCPLLDAAMRSPDVVCNAHLGMLRGALGNRHDADAVELQMEAFAEPGACVLLMNEVANAPDHGLATMSAHEAEQQGI